MENSKLGHRSHKPCIFFIYASKRVR